ncbi:MAG: MarR family transcriptional regulator [Xanthomonadales bacterium]|nr:MarR family transcriptional regulator [Xanthomonadales bacterium]
MPETPRIRWQTLSWFAVVRTYQECQRRYSALLRHYDLTVTQFDVLNSILRLGDQATPHAIAEELVVTRGNITGVVQRLQEHGWIATRPNEADGRSFVCTLTDSGYHRLEQARRAAALFIDRQLEPFSDQELQETRRQMDRMREHLLTIDPDAVAAQADQGSNEATPAGVTS